MTQEEIERLKALAEAATPGPWHFTGTFIVAGAKEEEEVAEAGASIKLRHNMAFIAAARDALPRLIAELEAARAHKDGAYAERDRLVAALSKLFPSWLERHPDADTAWEDDWRWIVFVQLPTGQCSWHIHVSELTWFDHLERRAGNSWDGHTNDVKYARLAALRFSKRDARMAELERELEAARADCDVMEQNWEDALRDKQHALDQVELLREQLSDCLDNTDSNAALRERLEKAEGLLRPFADEAAGADHFGLWGNHSWPVAVERLRAARAFLQKEEL